MWSSMCGRRGWWCLPPLEGCRGRSCVNLWGHLTKKRSGQQDDSLWKDSTLEKAGLPHLYGLIPLWKKNKRVYCGRNCYLHRCRKRPCHPNSIFSILFLIVKRWREVPFGIWSCFCETVSWRSGSCVKGRNYMLCLLLKADQFFFFFFSVSLLSGESYVFDNFFCSSKLVPCFLPNLIFYLFLFLPLFLFYAVLFSYKIPFTLASPAFCHFFNCIIFLFLLK